jgi:hypothetical protein
MDSDDIADTRLRLLCVTLNCLAKRFGSLGLPVSFAMH